MQRFVQYVFYVVFVCACLSIGSFAAIGHAMALDGTGNERKGNEVMGDRIQLSEQKSKELLGDAKSSVATTDPDFAKTMERFIFGEVYQQGNLNDKQRELISLVALATIQNEDELKLHTVAALKAGVTPVEIKEAMYQCAPYIGFPKTSVALEQVNLVFKRQGISLPVENQTRVTEETRFDQGLAVQKRIFGDVIDQAHANAPQNQKHIQNYLSAFCFGDTYTRGGLDLKTRELLTLAVIASLGGCESQVKAHVKGNVSVGNDKETLISAITQCLPYIGFPRTLNALSCINEVIPEN